MSSTALSLPAKPSLLQRALKFTVLAAIGVLLLVPLAIAVHLGYYDSFFENPLSGWGMWGTFAIYAATRPTRKELITTTGLAVALRISYDLFVGERGYNGSLFLVMGTFLGLTSLPVLVIRSLGTLGERRTICRRSLAIVALFSYLGICLTFYLKIASLMLPHKLDYFLYSFDGSLGLQPSVLFGRLTQKIYPLHWLEAMVYNSLGFWFGLVYAVHMRKNPPCRISILKLFIANALIGFSLYYLFPAMGPKYAFPSFPEPPKSIHPVAISLAGAPNAMPSLHLGGALLLCWMSKPWKWLYRITAVFTALTALATLGLGEHYLIDLVVGVPYALGIYAFSAEPPQRRVPLFVASFIVLFWLVYLRIGWYWGPLSWMLVLVSVGVCLFLEHRLSQSAMCQPGM